jgi:S-adenosylmethionine uptake transporter
MSSKVYIIAPLWFLLHVLMSSFNDCLAISLGATLPAFEIVFFRFFFSMLVLLPFMFEQGKGAFKTEHIPVHMARGALLFGGIAIWVMCLGQVPMVMVTIMGFTIPIFFIILASFLLKEEIGQRRLLITIVGFLGVLLVVSPTSSDFKPISLLLLPAVIFFALLDVINKKFISKESTINMLFYSSLFTCLFSLIPAVYKGFIMPSLMDLSLCLALGSGANLILYALLKSFSLADASSLAPLRYVELIFSSIFGYLFFNQIPGKSLYLGAFIIISCNLLLIYLENSKKAKSV